MKTISAHVAKGCPQGGLVPAVMKLLIHELLCLIVADVLGILAQGKQNNIVRGHFQQP